MKAPGTRRLLILDDELAVARTVAFSAERSGFTVRISESAEDFFGEAARFGPTHIIIDLLMPGMDGVEVLRRLAEMECSAGIIMMSGMGTKVLESAQRVGVERGLCISGILLKPFKPAQLRALLDADVRAPVRPGRIEEIDRDVSVGSTPLPARQGPHAARRRCRPAWQEPGEPARRSMVSRCALITARPARRVERRTTGGGVTAEAPVAVRFLPRRTRRTQRRTTTTKWSCCRPPLRPPRPLR